MMSCSATAISSSSNFCSGLSTAFAAFTGFGVAAGFTTRAMSASPFQIRDGAGKLSGLSFQPSHPLRVATPFGLGKLADYPTVHTLHALQADSLGEFNCHLVIDVRRRCRPTSSDQVLLLGRISGHVGLEPRRPAALVASQHTDENATFAFVEVLGGKHRLHLLESHRPDGQQLYEIFGGGRCPSPSPPRGEGRGEGRGHSTCDDREEMRLDPDPPRRHLPARLPHRLVPGGAPPAPAPPPPPGGSGCPCSSRSASPGSRPPTPTGSLRRAPPSAGPPRPPQHAGTHPGPWMEQGSWPLASLSDVRPQARRP